MGCGIARETNGSSSTLMARGKRPANAPCRVRPISRRHSADWTRSAPLAISDASGVKSFGPERLCSRPIRTNASARSLGYQGQATAIIEGNVRHESRSFGCLDGYTVMRPPVSPGVSYPDMRRW